MSIAKVKDDFIPRDLALVPMFL